jgi:hypothetical protein
LFFTPKFLHGAACDGRGLLLVIDASDDAGDIAVPRKKSGID